MSQIRDYDWDDAAAERRTDAVCAECGVTFVGFNWRLRCRYCQTRHLALQDFLWVFGIGPATADWVTACATAEAQAEATSRTLFRPRFRPAEPAPTSPLLAIERRPTPNLRSLQP